LDAGRDKGGETQARTSFLKKRSKKLLISPAVQRPDFGRSKAGEIKSFCALFSKSAACFSADGESWMQA
jgi:hypothetical protein